MHPLCPVRKPVHQSIMVLTGRNSVSELCRGGPPLTAAGQLIPCGLDALGVLGRELLRPEYGQGKVSTYRGQGMRRPEPWSELV
ncbi:hypothetical protein GCM10023335_38930 [Streptomyces siamensis]|uniref:Uncharacterized protein n=1 Tax=Streptomyces siamensis TaxID=1274986 RepID=A0ABP9J0X2_9ACTN